MKQIKWAIALVGVICAFNACQKPPESEQDDVLLSEDTTALYGAKVVNSNCKLPVCNTSNKGQLYYIADKKEFRYCTGKKFELADLSVLNGKDGDPGASCHAAVAENGDAMVICDDGSSSVIQNGVDGENGTSFHSNAGEPTNDIGYDGDTYLDISTSKVYKKSNGEWSLEGFLGCPACNEEPSSSSIASYSSTTDVAWCERDGNCGSLVDNRDGKQYRWTKIGNQTWMAENLNYEKGWCYGVGDKDTSQHQDSSSCENGFGRIYDWKTVMNVDPSNPDLSVNEEYPVNYRGLCPQGWHIPNAKEWDELAQTLDQWTSAQFGLEGRFMKAIIPGNAFWNSVPNNAWDPYGISIKPAGWRYMDGTWLHRDSVAILWSVGRNQQGWVPGRYLYAGYPNLESWTMDEISGSASLRCVKD